MVNTFVFLSRKYASIFSSIEYFYVNSFNIKQKLKEAILSESNPQKFSLDIKQIILKIDPNFYIDYSKHLQENKKIDRT